MRGTKILAVLLAVDGQVDPAPTKAPKVSRSARTAAVSRAHGIEALPPFL